MIQIWSTNQVTRRVSMLCCEMPVTPEAWTGGELLPSRQWLSWILAQRNSAPKGSETLSSPFKHRPGPIQEKECLWESFPLHVDEFTNSNTYAPLPQTYFQNWWRNSPLLKLVHFWFKLGLNWVQTVSNSFKLSQNSHLVIHSFNFYFSMSTLCQAQGQMLETGSLCSSTGDR